MIHRKLSSPEIIRLKLTPIGLLPFTDRGRTAMAYHAAQLRKAYQIAERRAAFLSRRTYVKAIL